MLTNLILTVNIVLPLTLVMAAGFLARRAKLLDEGNVDALNKLVFRIFLPILLCDNIMSVDDSQAIGGPALIFALAAVLILFAALSWLIPRIEREPCRRGVLIQGIMRSNYALFGIPLAQSIYPGQTLSIASLLVMVVIPVFNVLSIIALEMHRGAKCSLAKIMKGVVNNPLIWACLIGIVLWKLPLELPPFARSTMRQLGSIASPLALFALGAALNLRGIRGNRRALTIGVVGRLLVVPLVFLPIAVLLGFRNVELASLMCVFATPSAVSSYTMACLMDGDGDLAGSQVVLTTVFSSLTVFAFVFLGKALGLI